MVKDCDNMSVLLSLEFEGLPPTANTMYRNSGSRRYKRQEVQDWQEEIAGLMSEQWHGRPYPRRTQVNIKFTTKDKRHLGHRQPDKSAVRLLRNCRCTAE